MYISCATQYACRSCGLRCWHVLWRVCVPDMKAHIVLSFCRGTEAKLLSWVRVFFRKLRQSAACFDALSHSLPSILVSFTAVGRSLSAHSMQTSRVPEPSAWQACHRVGQCHHASHNFRVAGRCTAQLPCHPGTVTLYPTSTSRL